MIFGAELSSHNDLLIQRSLSVLRIVSAYFLIQHDTAKLFGFPHVASFDNLQILSLIGVAGILEVLGGTLLLIGLLARPVAFILSGLLAFAYFIGHASNGSILSPLLNQGESAVLFFFVFLFFAVASGGAWRVARTQSHLSDAGQADECCVLGCLHPMRFTTAGLWRSRHSVFNPPSEHDEVRRRFPAAAPVASSRNYPARWPTPAGPSAVPPLAATARG